MVKSNTSQAGNYIPPKAGAGEEYFLNHNTHYLRTGNQLKIKIKIELKWTFKLRYFKETKTYVYVEMKNNFSEFSGCFLSQARRGGGDVPAFLVLQVYLVFILGKPALMTSYSFLYPSTRHIVGIW